MSQPVCSRLRRSIFKSCLFAQKASSIFHRLRQRFIGSFKPPAGSPLKPGKPPASKVSFAPAAALASFPSRLFEGRRGLFFRPLRSFLPFGFSAVFLGASRPGGESWALDSLRDSFSSLLIPPPFSSRKPSSAAIILPEPARGTACCRVFRLSRRGLAVRRAALPPIWGQIFLDMALVYSMKTPCQEKQAKNP